MDPVATATGFAAAAGGEAHLLADALDETLELSGDAAHHLGRVRRLRADAHLTATDGRGRWRPYTLTGATRHSLTLRAAGDAVVEPALRPPLWVGFGLTKGQKPETVVRGLTELGVDRIVPLVTERVVRRPRAERIRVETGRLRRVAVAALEQCRRARLPEIEEPMPPAQLRELGGPGARVVFARRGAASIDGSTVASADPLVLVVGPEGGLTTEEIETLAPDAGVGVGVHVLRAETAALAAAAVVTGWRGAW